MFTVKLFSCRKVEPDEKIPDALVESVRVVEAQEVAVHTHPTSRRASIEITDAAGQSRAFIVTAGGKPDPEFAAEEYFSLAYIENASGATTETVRV